MVQYLEFSKKMNKQEKINYILKTLDMLGFLEANKGLNEKIKNLSEEKLTELTKSLHKQVKLLIQNLNTKKRKIQKIGEKIEDIKSEIEIEKLDNLLTNIK